MKRSKKWPKNYVKWIKNGPESDWIWPQIKKINRKITGENVQNMGGSFGIHKSGLIAVIEYFPVVLVIMKAGGGFWCQANL